MKTNGQTNQSNGANAQTTQHDGGTAMEQNIERGAVFARITGRNLGVSVVALAMALSQTMPAYATIDNTVEVFGTPPAGSNQSFGTADEEVDVEDATPNLTVTKTATFDLGAGTQTAAGAGDDVTAGTTITYTYTVENTGNIGLINVDLTDDHATDADGTLSAFTLVGVTNDGGAAAGDSTDDAADADFDYLAPGDTVTWTATYTVTLGDISAASADGDGLLENTVTAEGDYEAPAGTPQSYSETASEDVGLIAPNPSLAIAKLAYLDDFPSTHALGGTGVTTADGSTDNVALNDVIYYAYTVTNDGNVPITAITLTDTHNGVSGALTPVFYQFTINNGDGGGNFSANTGNTIDILYPGDEATFAVSYTVTQSDIDDNQ